MFFHYVLFSNIAVAQRDLGTITGTITDAQGAAVPNAKVTILEDATGLTYHDSNQRFRVVYASGPEGRDLFGHSRSTRFSEVPAEGNCRQSRAGDCGEHNDAGRQCQSDRRGNCRSAASANRIARDRREPERRTTVTASSRRPAYIQFLARMAPGVLPAEQGARDALGGDFSANGVRSTGENNFLLNGVDNNVNVIDFINQTSFVIGPSMEAIGEMQILTNGYNAEYGRAAGGVVNVNLKSGTNQVHGVLFEILQNTKLNANRWENNLGGNARNPFKQNQFGGAVGGPIIKNKLFMFGDYQGTRIATAGGTIQNLGYGGFYDDSNARQWFNGDFSRLLGSRWVRSMARILSKRRLRSPQHNLPERLCS